MWTPFRNLLLAFADTIDVNWAENVDDGSFSVSSLQKEFQRKTDGMLALHLDT